ncbi:uncharacterized protein G2W53_003490 [Senna tora]|uniref:Uncharacterized protein n=1 Tax=Senna tora TaxID=362788 RepID=A0A834XB61_9FABA|nr:uncharacterized protein G2W53_003490 [Senna tora]
MTEERWHMKMMSLKSKSRRSNQLEGESSRNETGSGEVNGREEEKLEMICPILPNSDNS